MSAVRLRTAHLATALLYPSYLLFSYSEDDMYLLVYVREELNFEVELISQYGVHEVAEHLMWN